MRGLRLVFTGRRCPQKPGNRKIDGITLYKTSRQIQPKIYQDKQIEKYHRWFIYWAGKFDRLWQWPHLDFFRLWEKLKQIQADIYIHASPNYESGLINLTVRLVGKKSFYMVANDEIYYWGIKSAGVIWCLSGRHRKIIKEKYHLEAINLPCWFPRPKTTLPFKRNYLLWVGRIECANTPKRLLN